MLAGHVAEIQVQDHIKFVSKGLKRGFTPTPTTPITIGDMISA